jgi:hypothetical protein
MKPNICIVLALLLATAGVCRGATYRFVDGDGYRDLLVDDKPIWRDMIKYDPADRENTYKPYKHMYGFGGDGEFITKGAGGTHPHHRGIFLGFKTQFGDFWHCPDVTQRHVKYLSDREMAGPDSARDAQVIEWVGKDDKPVVRDTREITTRVVSPTDIIMDFDITLEALTDDPIDLGGDAHHAGFHFRAAQEVHSTNAKSMGGSATYISSSGAKLTKNDVWENCDWTHMMFPIKDRKYALTHFDAPTNPRPIQYSLRPYGRVGSFFTGKLTKGAPLKLRYRLRLRDGASAISAEQLAAEYKEYSDSLK